MKNALVKLLRSARLYGPRRAFVKGVSRVGARLPLSFAVLPRERSIGLLGCGQFGFATICHFVATSQGRRFGVCYDADPKRANLTKACWGFRKVAGSAEEVTADPTICLLYIASNHASHAGYAIAALDAGKTVYVEKPVAVSPSQLAALVAAEARSPARLYVGYNRPFSAAVRRLRSVLPSTDEPMTISCVIAGHVLAPDHWYRDPGEGTRMCGNVGHWLDLAVNLLSLGSVPDRWTLRLAPSNSVERDENVAITLTSDRGDLVSIVLTARAEPFDGIHEAILVQKGNVMARIDDFQSMTVWRGAWRKRWSYWPKDVGHRRALLQPFRATAAEQAVRWQEVVASSLWMLEFADMVVRGDEQRDFSFLSRRAHLTARCARTRLPE